MHRAEYWLMVLFLIGAAGTAFWFIWNRWRRASLVADTPTAKIRSAPQGYAELCGRAVFGDELWTASPLSGRRCLWFRYKVEQRGCDLRGRKGWRTLHGDCSETPFLVVDDTGRCTVDPRGAEVTSTHKQIWYGEYEWPSGAPRVTRPPSLFGIPLAAGGPYRYTEELLLEGEIYALGWFETTSSAQRSVNARVGELLRSWKAEQPRLIRRFDRNGDHRIDTDEWQQARAAALAQVLQQQVSQQAAESKHTLRRPADKRFPFLLSDQAPRDLARRYRTQARVSLVLFAASSLTVLWLLGQRV